MSRATVTNPLMRSGRAWLESVAVLGQRLVLGLLVLIAIIFLTYLGLDLARGQELSPTLMQAAWKTIDYAGRLAQGDLGLTAAGSILLRPVPIAEVIATTLPRSLGLLAAALFTATLLGVMLGVFAARYRYSNGSLLILLTSIIGISAPSFFVALLLQLLVIYLSQKSGYKLVPVGGFGWDEHIVLPMLVLASRPIAQITRVTFVAIGEVLGQDFIRTAHGKGIHPVWVLTRHVLRNAAIPILTTVGVSLRFSLSSLPLVEFFFGWNGVGFILLKSIARRDDHLTVSLLLCLGLLFILVNLMLELSYRFIDPRLRQTQPHIEREQGQFIETIKTILNDLWQSISATPLLRWRKRSEVRPEVSPLRAVSAQVRHDDAASTRLMRAERRRRWVQATLGNLPLLLGVIVVAGLVSLFVYGPNLTPHNPYTTQGLLIKNGQISSPPYPPNDTYPWGTDVLGRDIMSQVIAGAQQTLIMVILAVLARMLVGFGLGAVAGWLHGRWPDRLIMGLAEIIATFPTLLLAMILILALGIRQGMQPFIVAFCLVGWGEIMQFVRSEVMAIRPKLFIEAALSVGVRWPRLMLGHILPNLVPALVSLAALEMAAVLVLLGELGFVGIFIGGGAFAELDWQRPLYHYSDVPEWGAMLSNVRTYARAHPWMAIYPSLAFFVSILGFNLLGEGLRRLVEQLGVGITRLINRYTIAAALAVLLIISWARANTGPVSYYRTQAVAFNGQTALTHVQALADPALEGRALGRPGLDKAADYIAQVFNTLGLQAAGEEFTYFQTRSRAYGALTAAPRLTLEDGGPPLTYRRDYAEYPYTYLRNWGYAQAPLRVILAGDLTAWSDPWQPPPAFKGIEVAQDIVVLLSPRLIGYVTPLNPKGVLVVTENEADLNRYRTLSARDPNTSLYATSYRLLPDVPVLWVSQQTADRLLAGTGQTAANLRYAAGQLNQNQVEVVRLPMTASMEITGVVVPKTPVRHVIGHWPGQSADLGHKLIIVLAQYDGAPLHPAAAYPAANDNASGVAVMLEAIRAMQTTGYQPYKTFLFVAYSGEGQEGGESAYPPNVEKFLEAKYGFTGSFDLEAVIHLRGLGAGSGDGLAIKGGGSLRLANLFETAAQQMGARAYRAGDEADLSIVFEDRPLSVGGQDAPEVELNWQGWQDTSRQPTDTAANVSADKLQQSGRALTLALMLLGRETQY